MAGEAARITQLERQVDKLANRVESLERAAANNIKYVAQAREILLEFQKDMRNLNVKIFKRAKSPYDERLSMLEERIEALEPAPEIRPIGR